MDDNDKHVMMIANLYYLASLYMYVDCLYSFKGY